MCDKEKSLNVCIVYSSFGPLTFLHSNVKWRATFSIGIWRSQKRVHLLNVLHYQLKRIFHSQLQEKRKIVTQDDKERMMCGINKENIKLSTRLKTLTYSWVMLKAERTGSD